MTYCVLTTLRIKSAPGIGQGLLCSRNLKLPKEGEPIAQNTGAQSFPKRVPGEARRSVPAPGLCHRRPAPSAVSKQPQVPRRQRAWLHPA